MTTALAPAKLNLYLDVLARRPDGYHELETLFLALPWGDEVDVRSSSPPGVHLDLVSSDADVPADERNLAFRAAAAYLTACRASGARQLRGLHVRLVKHVPAGSGLGGGSSDAGAVLRVLDREFGHVPAATLDALALSLGADVPFFLGGAVAAVGRGRGELLEPVPVGGRPALVLILPPAHHATARVFARSDVRVRPAPPGGLEAAVEALRSGDPERLRRTHHNALAHPAMAAYPAYVDVVREVERRLGRPPCMSGTGSALYDWPGPEEGEDVLDRLAGLEARVVLVPAEQAPC